MDYAINVLNSIFEHISLFLTNTDIVGYNLAAVFITGVASFYVIDLFRKKGD